MHVSVDAVIHACTRSAKSCQDCNTTFTSHYEVATLRKQIVVVFSLVCCWLRLQRFCCIARRCRHTAAVSGFECKHDYTGLAAKCCAPKAAVKCSSD